MFTNWLTYRAVAEALDSRLKGAVILEAFTQMKNELVVVLRSGEDELYLQCSVEPRSASLLLKSAFGRARRNSLDLFPDLAGDLIENVRVAASDRIIRIGLLSGRMLFVVLFPVKANILLTDSDAHVLDSFKHSKAPPGIAALTFNNAMPQLSSTEVQNAVSRVDGNVLSVLRDVHPWISGTLAEEMLRRVNLDSTLAAKDLSTDQRSDLQTTVETVLREASAGRCHVYLEDGQTRAVSLIELGNMDTAEHVEFDDILEGLFFFVRKRYRGNELAITRKRVLDTIGRELQRLHRTRGKLSSPSELRVQAEEYEKFGNLLMIHLYDQPEQPGRMTVPDIFTDPRLVVTIPLKERTTVLENAQRYFQKAQQTKASIIHVEERSKNLEERAALLQAFADQVASALSTQELKPIFKEHAAAMDELGLTPKGEKNESPFPFRRFVVTGGFEVWAGKNSANNDLLTLRHSRPNDLWFHTRGVGGSHVVLKVGSAAGDPSKEAIRQAASIAAYYSKHRNAKRVPVAYTEKKYVRKPKGAAPGSVLVDREKVIMVDPNLPDAA